MLIAVLGAASEVVMLGAVYLMIIFAASPFRIMGLISDRALQGTGDTRTPMVVGVVSNIANIGLSVVLALGLGPFPGLGVPGVGWGTFFSKFLAAAIYIALFLLPGGRLNLRIPDGGWNFTITRQLFRVSIPNIMQGGYQSLITFPFNALVLLFGTEAAAAYHIGRRVQQQLIAPLQRAYGSVTTIMAGQNLGRGLHNESGRVTRGMLWLTAITIGLAGGVLFITAPGVVGLFTDDRMTILYGTGFLRALSLGAPIFAFFRVLSGLLTGAGDTRTPFYGSVVSQTFFLLGLSYLLSVPLGLGLTGVFIGLVSDYCVQAGWVARRFLSGKWISEAREMIEERRSASRARGP